MCTLDHHPTSLAGSTYSFLFEHHPNGQVTREAASVVIAGKNIAGHSESSVHLSQCPIPLCPCLCSLSTGMVALRPEAGHVGG